MTYEKYEGSDPTDEAAAQRYDYGPDAQTGKSWDGLAQKSKAVIQAMEAMDKPMEAQNDEIAEEAGCTGSHVSYVKKNFPHIINHRVGTMQIAPDGGEPAYQVEITRSEALKAIRILPEELSHRIARQVFKD